MPANIFRDNYFQGLGGKHAYKTGTANATAASVVAAVTGKKLRVKAFRFIAAMDWSATAAADLALNAAWLADGTTATIGLAIIAGVDTTTVVADARELKVDTGVVLLPSEGIAGTAATALNIDFTATDTKLTYQLDVWYDEID